MNALIIGIVVALIVVAIFVYRLVKRSPPATPPPRDDAEAVVRVADLRPVIKPADVVGDKGAETYYRLFGGGAPDNWREIRDGYVANQPARDWSYKDSRTIRWDGNWLLAQGKAGEAVVYEFDTQGRPAKISIAKQSGGNSYEVRVNEGKYEGLTDSGDIPVFGVGTFAIRFVDEGTASVAGFLLPDAPQVAPDATRR